MVRDPDSGLYLPPGLCEFRGALAPGGRVTRLAGRKPRLVSINPNFGTDAGGTQVTISFSSGAESVTAVTFDGVAGTITSRTSTEVVVTTPAGTAGDAKVVVSIGDREVRKTDQSRLAYEYTASGGLPSDMVFASDWGTLAGSTDDAIRDTGKTKPWPVAIRTASLEVVDATAEGLTGWPSPNALKVIGVDGGFGAQSASVRIRQSDALWATPGVGESLYFRYYLNIPESFCQPAGSGGTGPTDHPIENTEAGGTEADWATNYQGHDDSVDKWFHISLWSIATSSPNNLWHPGGTSARWDPNTTYRLEWQITPISTTEYNMHARLYDAAGNLMHGDDGFFDGNNNTTLADTPTLTLNNAVDNSWLDIVDFGTSGIAPNELPADITYPFDLYRWGAFAVRTDDWCGPYDSQEATY